MAYRWRGMGDPITGPVTTAVGAPVPPGPSSAPAGYWVNPANTSQYLPQSDAAKIGNFCMQGPTIGQWAVGGNYGNSVLYCANLPCQKGLMIEGGIGVAMFLLLPSPWKWLGLVPAGWSVMSCMLGGIT